MRAIFRGAGWVTGVESTLVHPQTERHLDHEHRDRHAGGPEERAGQGALREGEDRCPQADRPGHIDGRLTEERVDVADHASGKGSEGYA